MSEQERHGQEPHEPREPYATYPPGHGTPADGQGHDPYAAQRYDAPQHESGGRTYGGDAYGYDTGTGTYDTGTYATGPYQGSYDTGSYDTGTQPAYGTGTQPAYGTGTQPAYDTGTQPAYGTGSQPAYDTGQQRYEPYDTGSQAAYDPAHHPQDHTQQYPAAPQHPGPATGTWHGQHNVTQQHGTQAQPHGTQQRHAGQPYGTQEPPHGTQQYAAQPHAAQPSGGHAQQRDEQNEHYGDGFPAAPHGSGERPGVPPHGEHLAEGDPAAEEEFAFVEEEDEQAEDVIDWLKFSESRAERRDERRRRTRVRSVAITLAAVLAVAGGGTYAWHAGLIPGVGGNPAATPLSAQKRDVIAVHLREVGSNDSATVLLVRNETTGRGTTLLLPNSLLVSDDGGTPVPLGNSVVDAGAAPTRDGLDTLLGANIQGTWRLDTPFLEVLVNAVGGIVADTNATIEQSGRAVVTAGKDQNLNGHAAVAYATYRAPGEPPSAQLARFGQVLRAVLTQIPSSAAAASKIIDEVGSVPDPSLSNAQLGATLAALSDLAKSGHYTTEPLTVLPNGTVSAGTTNDVVKQILGGTVKNSDVSGVPVVSVADATTDHAAAGAAQVQVVDSGNTYVNGGKQTPRTTSRVLYPAASAKSAAQQLAKTLGLPAGDVARGTGAANADITVILGADYHPPAAMTG